MIWQPTNDFLDHVGNKKRQATKAYLTRDEKPVWPHKYHHGLMEPVNEELAQLHARPDHPNVPDLPTVLLSHVPLYRDPGTRCGWLREKYPPSNLNEFEERNAIKVHGGYQYQNVLSQQVTKSIAEKVGNIDYAFSGDDHDYCEVTHRAYPSAGRGIHEITVKSLSFAMGIERPGFVLASLWNPIDEAGLPVTGSPGALRNPTLHSHLCLLPNQLAVFVQYGFYFIVTVVILTVRSMFSVLLERNPPEKDEDYSILPTTEPQNTVYQGEPSHARSVSHSGLSGDRGSLSARSSKGKAPMSSVSGYGLPSVDDYESKKKEAPWSTSTKTVPKTKKRFILQWGQQLLLELAWVGIPSIAWFIWLWRNT